MKSCWRLVSTVWIFGVLSKSGECMLNEAKLGNIRLSAQEREQLRRDMAESSAWAKAVFKRRRDTKNQKNPEHGIGDGIDKVDGCN